MGGPVRGVYLASYKAYHPEHCIVYQDIDTNLARDIYGDMMEVDLTPFDFVIASPPCNYWSKAIGNRPHSEYALKTRHLLPDILKKLLSLGKPFLVENVRNSVLFKGAGLFDLPCFVYEIGRHTYWSNVFMSKDVEQFKENIKNLHGGARQGGLNVHQVVEFWLYQIGA